MNDEESYAAESRSDETPRASSLAWDAVTRWCLYAVAFLTPLWFLPLTVSPLEANKLFLVSLFVAVGFVAWLGMGIYTSSVSGIKSWPLFLLFVWLVTVFLASFFSVNPYTSFWASGASSFTGIAVGALVALLAATNVRNGSHVWHVYLAILGAAGIIILFEVAHLLIGVRVLPWEFSLLSTFNPVGSWNALGIFFGFVVFLAFPLLSGTYPLWIRVVAGVVGAASLIGAALVNFPLVWVLVGALSLFLLAYNLRVGTKRGILGIALFLFLVSILLFLSRNQISFLTASFFVPLDVTPNISASWSIAERALYDRPVFGVGPGMFRYAWDRYRQQNVNETDFWNTRFEAASSFATTLPITTGIVGALGFLTFFISVLIVGVRALPRLDALGIALFSGMTFLLLSWFIYPLSSAISILTFLALGTFIAYAAERSGRQPYTLAVPTHAGTGFLMALLIILLMVAAVVGFYLTGQKYLAAVFFGQGVTRFNTEGSVNTTERLFQRAVSFDAKRDEYPRSLAQISLVQLRNIVAGAENAAPEDLRNNFQLALSNAISHAQRATEANPANPDNWRQLGRIYEAVIPFVSGASNSALDAYARAREYAPLDPTFLDDRARVYIAVGDHVNAKEELYKAIELKSDYAPAHFRLAQIFAFKGDTEEAIRSAENAVLAVPGDVGVLFQLGLLYYQADRLEDAQQVLERAVSMNPNFSNARYFLGLAYGRLGNRAKAIDQFERVSALNPGNEEIEEILANLGEGRPPLSGISPPAPNPIEREELPVEEE